MTASGSLPVRANLKLNFKLPVNFKFKFRLGLGGRVYVALTPAVHWHCQWQTLKQAALPVPWLSPLAACQWIPQALCQWPNAMTVTASSLRPTLARTTLGPTGVCSSPGRDDRHKNPHRPRTWGLYRLPPPSSPWIQPGDLCAGAAAASAAATRASAFSSAAAAVLPLASASSRGDLPS